MWLQVYKKYHAILDENIKLKEDQSALLMGLKTREEKVKELEEKDTEVQEDREEKSKELILTQQSKSIETLDKAIQTQSIEAKVSNHVLCM